jgi:hypothetical protein
MRGNEMTTQTMIKAKVTAYKPSGKYYAAGEGAIPTDWYLMQATRDSVFGVGQPVPGLSTRGEEFLLVVEPVDGGTPFMIMPEVV